MLGGWHLLQEVSLEDMERLTEDTAEAKEYEDRVRALLGEALTAEDDAAVLQELAQMERTEAAEEAAQLPEVPKVGKANSSLGSADSPLYTKRETASRACSAKPRLARQVGLYFGHGFQHQCFSATTGVGIPFFPSFPFLTCTLHVYADSQTYGNLVAQVEPVSPEMPELTAEEKAQLEELPSVPKTRPQPSQLQQSAAKAQKEAAREEPLAA